MFDSVYFYQIDENGLPTYWGLASSYIAHDLVRRKKRNKSLEMANSRAVEDRPISNKT